MLHLNRFIHFVLLLIFSASVSYSQQIFFNNGALVQINPGAIVKVNGGAENSNSGTLTNQGLFYVSNDGFAGSGTYTMNNASQSQGDGDYIIDQDWVNNANFTCNSSEVRLTGNAAIQLITGSQVTTFFDLTLESPNNNTTLPNARMTINSFVSDVLNLNDRELETQTNTLFVTNPSTAAITNFTAVATLGTEGFVSSISPGTLSRETNSNSSYLFPVGSSLGIARYRPVSITPNVTGNATYTVRMVNNDPNTDNFNRNQNDGLMCLANDKFYHAINRSNGIISADIDLSFLPISDGAWTNMSHWRTNNNIWNDMGTTSINAGVYSRMVRPTWLFANPGDPYVLTVLKPESPVMTCPSEVCDNNPTANFSANSATPGVSYNWIVPSGSTLVSGQGSSNAIVNWNSNGQFIYVQSQFTINGQTCASENRDSCSVIVNQTPSAVIAGGVDPTNTLTFNFNDNSIPTPSTWLWSFGDGSTSSQQNPSHTYLAPGTYEVVLVSSNGSCSSVDTTFVIIDYNEFFNVPNVFTPDEDGINEELFIDNSGIKEFSILIYDRWGLKKYESTDPYFRWNGKGLDGQAVSDGTYYYIINATSVMQKKYDVKGHFYVFRRK